MSDFISACFIGLCIFIHIDYAELTQLWKRELDSILLYESLAKLLRSKGGIVIASDNMIGRTQLHVRIPGGVSSTGS